MLDDLYDDFKTAESATVVFFRRQNSNSPTLPLPEAFLANTAETPVAKQKSEAPSPINTAVFASTPITSTESTCNLHWCIEGHRREKSGSTVFSISVTNWYMQESSQADIL